MTHVLMTADTVGGVWTYAMELAAALRQRDVRVSLATMGQPLDEAQRDEVHRLNLLVYSSNWKLEWMQDPWSDVEAAGQWLLELEQALRPHVIHLNGYAHGALPFNAPRLIVAHSCVLSWCESVLGAGASAAWSQYRRAVQAGLQGADMIVAPTQAMLDMLHRCHGPTPPAMVIHNGRDSRRFVPLVKRPLVFSAGRWWDPAKNLAALDQAAQHVRWPVIVAGPTQHPDGSHHGHTPQHVQPVGPQSTRQIAQWVGIASIYALPARYEPFGLTVLEAALAGCALVLGDLPTFREIWGDTAVYVDPNDPQRIAQAINTLIIEPTHRRQLAQAARQRALQLSPHRMAQKYINLYDQVRRQHAQRRLQATG